VPPTQQWICVNVVFNVVHTHPPTHPHAHAWTCARNSQQVDAGPGHEENQEDTSSHQCGSTLSALSPHDTVPASSQSCRRAATLLEHGAGSTCTFRERNDHCVHLLSASCTANRALPSGRGWVVFLQDATTQGMCGTSNFKLSTPLLMILQLGLSDH
jgi:hypothetical protein